MTKTKGSQKTETVKTTARTSKVIKPRVEISSSESEMEEENGYVKLEKSMKKLFQDFKKEIKKELRDFEESLNFSNGKLDDIIKKMGSIQNVLNTMSEKQEKLENENKMLKTKVQELECSMEELQQYTRNKNIQIDGVPKQPNENLKEIVKTIGNKIDVPIKEEDIDAIHRIPTRSTNNPEPIVVQFLTRQMKEGVIQKAKSARLSTNDINVHVPIGLDRPIYVNDHLTRQRKEIMFQARQMKTERNYKFLWTRNGKIFIRKDERSVVINLNTKEDLKKIV
ncbi:spindle pole body component 110-like [Diaphorina citri]|uniref:Spindle pole body component 110-like n=1 Tax=Diaphorina citri TaxID=121845 RepID=A0A1S3DD01_DIACI|nr:spindle pole body component 110-like [Diaphorina citri]